MADGYARVSGKPGVAFVITGPGLTNALTAMAQARADSVPDAGDLGRQPPRQPRARALACCTNCPIRPRWCAALCPSFHVDRPEALDGALDRAFAALTTGRPGPVHIEMPTDVMPPALPRPAAPRQPAAPPPLPDADRAPPPAWLRAQRPVILAGGGARRAEAALRALAERAGRAGDPDRQRARPDARPSADRARLAQPAMPSAR